MDRFGRRFILMTMSTPYIIGWLMISLAVHPSETTQHFLNFNLFHKKVIERFLSGMLCIGRVIVGYSGGVCSAIVPCYIG